MPAHFNDSIDIQWQGNNNRITRGGDTKYCHIDILSHTKGLINVSSTEMIFVAVILITVSDAVKLLCLFIETATMAYPRGINCFCIEEEKTNGAFLGGIYFTTHQCLSLLLS